MDKPMQLLILILNKTECLDRLFENLLDIGVKGATAVESRGMARMMGEDTENMFGSIRMLIDPGAPSSKMIFMAVDKDLVDQVRKTVDTTLGGLNKPDTAVLFGLPIDFFDGKVSEK